MKPYERLGRGDVEAWKRETQGLAPLKGAERVSGTANRKEKPPEQSSGRRDPAEDEAWIEFTRGVAPLGKRSPTEHLNRIPEDDRDPDFDPASAVTTTDRSRSASRAKPSTYSLDRRTRDRLRRGRIEPEARLDLHGKRYVDAQREVSRFLEQGHRRGLRLILVITGRGSARLVGPPAAASNAFPGPEQSEPGVLRRDLPRWVRDGALASIVIHCEQAHAKHGGHGAFYVYLKKRR